MNSAKSSDMNGESSKLSIGTKPSGQNKKGKIYQVLGSNFKDYVISFDTPNNDGIIAMNDAGCLDVYDIGDLRYIKDVEDINHRYNIRSMLINDDYYKNNQGEKLE